MSDSALPIVILAGSDRRPGTMPHGGRDNHPLGGYKAVDLRIGDRTLVETLIDRLRDCGRLDPIYVAGPRTAFLSRIPGVSLIEADGTFGENIRTSVQAVRRRHRKRPMAFVTCDIVPDVATVRELMVDYDREAPCDFWFPIVQAPEDPGKLGASSWKPAYRVLPQEGEEAIGVLPGHLAVFDPAALRLPFLYRLFQLGYRTRNRSIDYRRGVMVRGVVLELLYQDLLHLVTFRAPTLTWSVLRVGISAARDVREGRITRLRLEQALRKIFVKSRHRRRYPERRIVMPIVKDLSLALDIDTEEEARAAGARVGPASAVGSERCKDD